MGLARFMASTLGRVSRIVVGLALVVVGLTVMNGTGGWVIAIVGLVPLAAGGMNFCLFAPFLDAPFWGKDLPGKA